MTDDRYLKKQNILKLLFVCKGSRRSPEMEPGLNFWPVTRPDLGVVYSFTRPDPTRPLNVLNICQAEAIIIRTQLLEYTWRFTWDEAALAPLNLRSRIWAFDWYQNRWPWMTLNDVMALILRYVTESTRVWLNTYCIDIVFTWHHVYFTTEQQ